MNALRRFWHRLRRLFRRSQPEETPEQRLTGAQLARQRAVRRTEARRLAWHEARAALAEAERTGDRNVIERARHDEQVSREDYEAAHSDERAARDDVEAAKAAVLYDPEPIGVSPGELDAVMERRFKAHRQRQARHETLAVHRALAREMNAELARDHGVVADEAPPEPDPAEEPPEALIVEDARVPA